MRGYIARVQEDDAVREELIKVGDPDGEHQLVPKRKPTPFYPPNSYAESNMATTGGYTDRDRAKPKHWVTY